MTFCDFPSFDLLYASTILENKAGVLPRLCDMVCRRTKTVAKIIKVDGTEATLSDMSLKSLQQAVGGYIEIVNIVNGKLIICDEEGLIKGKPINEKASLLYAPCSLSGIVGDVVVCDKDDCRLLP